MLDRTRGSRYPWAQSSTASSRPSFTRTFERALLSRWKRRYGARLLFEHAKLAREKGFRVFMRYVALDTVERHIERVMRRAARGGHSASETTLRRIHASSLGNLPVALNPGERD